MLFRGKEQTHITLSRILVLDSAKQKENMKLGSELVLEKG